MKNPHYKVGMIVEHPKRPEWGRGKVVAVADERIYVVFREALSRTPKTLLTELVTLDVPEDQSDPILDLLPAAVQDGGGWLLPKNYERSIRKILDKVPAKTA